MLLISTKKFSELTTLQLHDLLQLRSKVFVLEQGCVYQDIDGNDQKAIHIIGVENNKIVAYARIFKAGDYFDKASIGRVVVDKNYRKKQYGHQIFKKSIEAVYQYFKETTIKISAQTYLIPFYESHGFNCIGQEYLEDNLPHIKMIKN